LDALELAPKQEEEEGKSAAADDRTQRQMRKDSRRAEAGSSSRGNIGNNGNGSSNSNGSSSASSPQEGGARLRKASDAMGSSKAKPRSSIDDLLSSQSSFRTSRDHKGGSDDDDDDDNVMLDLSLEKKRLSTIKARAEVKELEVGIDRDRAVSNGVVNSASRSRSSSFSSPRSRSNSLLGSEGPGSSARSVNMYGGQTPLVAPQPPSEEKPSYAQKLPSNQSPLAGGGAEAKFYPGEATAAAESNGSKRSGDDGYGAGAAHGKKQQPPMPAADAKLSAEQLAKFGIGMGVKADDNWLDEDFDADD
jgi:hypothetical protein